MSQSAGQGQSSGQKGGRDKKSVNISKNAGYGYFNQSPLDVWSGQMRSGMYGGSSPVLNQTAQAVAPELPSTTEEQLQGIPGIVDPNFTPAQPNLFSDFGIKAFTLADDVANAARMTFAPESGLLTAGLGVGAGAANLAGAYQLGTTLNSVRDVMVSPVREILSTIFGKSIPTGQDEETGNISYESPALNFLAGELGIGQATKSAITDTGYNLGGILNSGIDLASGLGAYDSLMQKFGTSAIAPMLNYLGLGSTIANEVGKVTGVDELTGLSNILGSVTSPQGLSHFAADAIVSAVTGEPRGLLKSFSNLTPSVSSNLVRSNLPSGNYMSNGGYLGTDGRYYSPVEIQALNSTSGAAEPQPTKSLLELLLQLIGEGNGSNQ